MEIKKFCENKINNLTIIDPDSYYITLLTTPLMRYTYTVEWGVKLGLKAPRPMDVIPKNILSCKSTISSIHLLLQSIYI